MSRAVCLFLSLAALAAAPVAWADEPIPTASNAGASGAPVDAKAPPPLDDPGAAYSQDDIIRIGPCGAVQRSSDQGPIDKQAHGQVDVGVGTGGYRHVGGVVCKPIGENGSVTIAVDHTEWNRSGRRRMVEVP